MQQPTNCPYQPVQVENPPFMVEAPCCPSMCGQDVLGVGDNQKLLEYQFGTPINVPYCGFSLQDQCMGNGLSTPNCGQCPCSIQGCNAPGGPVDSPCCDYIGFSRPRNEIFGPLSGNRNSGQRWG